MSNKNKSLGSANERRIVKKATDAGLRASKQPLSGVLDGFPNDLVIDDILVEAKVRAATLNARGDNVISLDARWIENVDEHARRDDRYDRGVLVIRRKYSDRHIVAMSWEFFVELLKARSKNEHL